MASASYKQKNVLSKMAPKFGLIGVYQANEKWWSFICYKLNCLEKGFQCDNVDYNPKGMKGKVL